MLYNVYSIRDVKTNSFSAPFLDVSDASATRGFLFSYQNSPNLINFAPADFHLFNIGKFNSDSGSMEPITPIFICDATRFVKDGVSDEE